ncbi:MAG: ABC transporter permease subunit [Acidobacteria bacterium]|jgi:ABC-2 type transport system permease protein|nr:ABC transporter permease subunit [Acidobacteriota bacterium]
MRNILTIAGKELRGYFVSPMGWVVMGFFALLFGYFFYAHLDYFVSESMRSQGMPVNINQGMIRGVLGNASVITLFLLPMITMRTYAEEKRSGTIELLLTSPITDIQIVLGKFLGAIGFYAALLGVTLLNIAILFVFGNPELMPVVTGYLGLFLQGSCLISLGLFISSTTKNQVVAGAATFVVALLLWIVSWLGSSFGPNTAAVLSYLSITEHFDDFSKGVIDTKHALYYLSVIAFGLFLTVKSVDTERWRG